MEITRDSKGTFLPIHNGKRTKLYRVWCTMKERCSNPHHKSFRRYGGRGISVCQEWLDFSVFRDWALASGYADGRTIDRVNNDGNYEPGNCRWATRREQNRNYSRNRMLTFNGDTKCVQDWAQELGINSTTILFRLKTGKTTEEALTKIDLRSLRFKNR